MSSAPPPQRLIVLGASNLTRGFHTLITQAAARYSPNIEIIAALGHGRSYGVPSRVLVRTLPSILDCGLWPALQSLPPRPTRALLTDVGNDILYGFDAPRIVLWINQALDRLQPLTADIALTGLPLDSVRNLSPPKFLFCRSILFPGSRISLERVRGVAEEVHAALHDTARARDLRFCNLEKNWYGFDPIHIRPSHCQSAWTQILCGDSPPPLSVPMRRSRMEAVKLYWSPPEYRQLLGRTQYTPQTGTPLKSGPRIWLF